MGNKQQKKVTTSPQLEQKKPRRECFPPTTPETGNKKSTAEQERRQITRENEAMKRQLKASCCETIEKIKQILREKSVYIGKKIELTAIDIR